MLRPVLGNHRGSPARGRGQSGPIARVWATVAPQLCKAAGVEVAQAACDAKKDVVGRLDQVDATIGVYPTGRFQGGVVRAGPPLKREGRVPPRGDSAPQWRRACRDR